MRFFVEENNTLVARLKFENFVEAWGFLSEVALHSEKENHHPRLTISYGDVVIELTSHDAGNLVTDKDYKLAGIIEWVYLKYE